MESHFQLIKETEKLKKENKKLMLYDLRAGWSTNVKHRVEKKKKADNVEQ